MKVCRQCGTEVFEEDGFCSRCGYNGVMLDIDVSTVPVSKSTRMVAMLLAILPGLVNVFGIGHLFLGRYIRAGILLMITAALFLTSGYIPEDWKYPFLILIFVIYFVQAMDVMSIVYGRN